MKKITEFTKKVKGQVKNPILIKASWIVGIDIGKKKIFLYSHEKRPNRFVPF